jgi:hypothetical protein
MLVVMVTQKAVSLVVEMVADHCRAKGGSWKQQQQEQLLLAMLHLMAFSSLTPLRPFLRLLVLLLSS